MSSSLASRLPRDLSDGMPFMGEWISSDEPWGSFSVRPKGFIAPRNMAVVFRTLTGECMKSPGFLRMPLAQDRIIVIETETLFACGCRSLRERALDFDGYIAAMEYGRLSGFIVGATLGDACLLHDAMRVLRRQKEREVKTWHEKWRGRNPAEADMSPFYGWPPDDLEDDPNGEVAGMWR